MTDEANCALLTGMMRFVAAAAVVEEADEAEEEARRGRFFDGVSGAKMPSSSSEADTMSESEKATLRFALFMREEEGVIVVVVQFALASPRIADLVGEADRECDGVLVGVFDADANAAPEEGSVLAAFFLRISLIVADMDSFNSTHSSSIIFTRRLKSLDETPYLSTNCICCTLETWARQEQARR